jgi:hypothetical protein
VARRGALCAPRNAPESVKHAPQRTIGVCFTISEAFRSAGRGPADHRPHVASWLRVAVLKFLVPVRPLRRYAARNENFVHVVEPHNGLGRAAGAPRRPPSRRRRFGEPRRSFSGGGSGAGLSGPRERRRWGVRPAVARRVWDRALARSRRSLGEGGRGEAPRSSSDPSLRLAQDPSRVEA